jgi:8-amino-7-oxononanoate synthase
MPVEIPLLLQQRLENQRKNLALRQLQLVRPGLTDFTSNDYLGIARSGLIQTSTLFSHGSTGSRLLSGNFEAAQSLESVLAVFHNSESAILFNSGYDANLGVLSCVPQEGDTIIYDILSHASIRDGIRLSKAESFPFLHNDLDDLERRLKTAIGTVYIVTESLFSMDGDLAPLAEMVQLCERFGAFLIVDEAHATGVIGDRGEGLVQHLELESRILARIHTFGKALGCHGAVILGSSLLRDYLINFSRPLIFSTALPPAAVEAIRISYTVFPGMTLERTRFESLVNVFQSLDLPFSKLLSSSPLQALIIPGNAEVTKMALELQSEGFDCRAIRYPTVPKSKERIRVVLHAFNSTTEIENLGKAIRKVVH